MTESAPHLKADDFSAIATLSNELKIPVSEVGVIYKNQFDRLAVQARITNFLVVLAMRNTRSILREGGRRANFR